MNTIISVANIQAASGGTNPFCGQATLFAEGTAAGLLYGGGAAAADGSNVSRGAAGAAGVCTVEWFS